ncbi:MAG TPA: hypothetical protein VFR20_04740 [Burkholderiaceae bacterium]|nr:hypothetical protein [Burkholderiaceae bacterium]
MTQSSITSLLPDTEPHDPGTSSSSREALSGATAGTSTALTALCLAVLIA